MASRAKIPDIPPTKRFHVFVCHEKNSLDIVRHIVEKLEENGVSCCYYDRDFQSGQSILDNMNDYIRQSVNMLIVLSDDFGQSPFCKYEVEQAFHLRMTEGYNMIPIKVEPCSVPECLKHLVYTDVEDDIENAHEVILDIILKKELQKNVGKGNNNGKQVQIQLKPYKPTKFSFKRFKLKFEDTDKSNIWKQNFEVPSHLFLELENAVNGSLFVKYLHIWRHPYWIIFNFHFHLLLVVMATFLTLLIVSGREVSDALKPPGYVLAIGLPIWFMSFVVCELICAYCDGNTVGIFRVYWQALQTLNVKLWRISRQNHKQTGVIFFVDSTYIDNREQLVLHIMAYNFTRCEMQFARHLCEKEELKKYQLEDESDEECTTRLFDNYLSKKANKLLVQSKKQYHTMVNGAKCACLLVEENLL